MDSNQHSLNSRIRESISNLSDEALIRMLETSPKDYTPFALAAAREEIAKRGGKDAIRQRIAQKTVQEAPLQIELSKRIKDILMVVPKAHPGWDYSFFEDKRIAAHIKVNTSWWGDAGEILIEDSVYPVYRILNGEQSGDLVLEYKESVLAKAQEAFFARSFKVEYRGKQYKLKPAIALSRTFHLFEKKRLLGVIATEEDWGESIRIKLPTYIPLPVCAFTFWLVVLAGKKWTD